jgi:uncharacterized protein
MRTHANQSTASTMLDSADLKAASPAGGPFLSRYPLATFFVLTFVISWLPAIPYAMGMFPSPVLPSGPFLAAVITAAIVGGRTGLRSFFRRLFRWRVGIGWYALALLGPVIGLALAAYVNVLLGAPTPSTAQLAGWSLIATATLLFVVNPLGGAWEEPGWRGYALPSMLRRQSALVASIGLGIVWTLWHVPLFVADIIPWQDAAAVFAMTFVFTAMYLRTGGSVLIALLLHAAINGAGEFFIGLFEGADRVRMYWLMAAVSALIAVPVILSNLGLWRRSPNVMTGAEGTM